MSGRLFIISGPSGAGKSSLCAALLKTCPALTLSISCTTRLPRQGEENGREYHFLSLTDFVAGRQAGHFLEWAVVHGNMYGTRQSDVEALLNNDKDVLLEIDWQGARQVGEKIPDAIRVFILPPSLDELRRRLIMRGQDEAHTVASRVAAAEAEMSHADEARYQIVNVEFDQALHELKGIVSKTYAE